VSDQSKPVYLISARDPKFPPSGLALSMIRDQIDRAGPGAVLATAACVDIYQCVNGIWEHVGPAIDGDLEALSQRLERIEGILEAMTQPMIVVNQDVKPTPEEILRLQAELFGCSQAGQIIPLRDPYTVGAPEFTPERRTTIEKAMREPAKSMTFAEGLDRLAVKCQAQKAERLAAREAMPSHSDPRERLIAEVRPSGVKACFDSFLAEAAKHPGNIFEELKADKKLKLVALEGGPADRYIFLTRCDQERAGWPGFPGETWYHKTDRVTAEGREIWAQEKNESTTEYYAAAFDEDGLSYNGLAFSGAFTPFPGENGKIVKLTDGPFHDKILAVFDKATTEVVIDGSVYRKTKVCTRGGSNGREVWAINYVPVAEVRDKPVTTFIDPFVQDKAAFLLPGDGSPSRPKCPGPLAWGKPLSAEQAVGLVNDLERMDVKSRGAFERRIERLKVYAKIGVILQSEYHARMVGIAREAAVASGPPTQTPKPSPSLDAIMASFSDPTPLPSMIDEAAHTYFSKKFIDAFDGKPPTIEPESPEPAAEEPKRTGYKYGGLL
jgi:hypothetical protein